LDDDEKEIDMEEREGKIEDEKEDTISEKLSEGEEEK
jgi:hypothetical protein